MTTEDIVADIFHRSPERLLDHHKNDWRLILKLLTNTWIGDSSTSRHTKLPVSRWLTAPTAPGPLVTPDPYVTCQIPLASSALASLIRASLSSTLRAIVVSNQSAFAWFDSPPNTFPARYLSSLTPLPGYSDNRLIYLAP